jgi:hypothetical protein
MGLANPNRGTSAMLGVISLAISSDAAGVFDAVSVRFGGRSRGVAVPMKLHKVPASRNDKCPCGSGLKFKKCCGKRQ